MNDKLYTKEHEWIRIVDNVATIGITDYAQEELGDILFASLDVARKLQLNPEISLAKSNNKFSKRWRRVEQYIIKDRKEFNDLNLKDFDFYWHKAKNN